MYSTIIMVRKLTMQGNIPVNMLISQVKKFLGPSSLCKQPKQSQKHEA